MRPTAHSSNGAGKGCQQGAAQPLHSRCWSPSSVHEPGPAPGHRPDFARLPRRVGCRRGPLAAAPARRVAGRSGAPPQPRGHHLLPAPSPHSAIFRRSAPRRCSTTPRAAHQRRPGRRSAAPRPPTAGASRSAAAAPAASRTRHPRRAPDQHLCRGDRPGRHGRVAGHPDRHQRRTLQPRWVPAVCKRLLPPAALLRCLRLRSQLLHQASRHCCDLLCPLLL